MNYINNIAKSLGIQASQVKNTVELLDEGATMPFIARYRKERTGSLDEVQIGDIKDELARLKELDKRRESITDAIEKQDKLTDELRAKLNACTQLNQLEDLYLPYKLKRKTRAVKAREKGLEPLAKILMSQNEMDTESKASQFLNDEVANEEEALQGARDIIAEWINENEVARSSVRNIFQRQASIRCKLVKGKEEEGIKFKDYFDSEEPLRKSASHRLLAMRRGEAEGILRVAIAPDEDEVLEKLNRIFVKGQTSSSKQVELAGKDAYKRLLNPSIETEFAKSSKEAADIEAIRVFAENLRQLLLSSPLGQKRVLAIDPGFRTGCKVVCLDAQGNLLHNETIYPHAPQNQGSMAARKLTNMVETYNIQAIAVGNGTAGRETERFVTNLHYDRKVQVFVVSEAGASIYSASKVAREEFPEYDVTVRGAVSIGRRLMDPLAELVKIEPKSIGVGQYQHDVDQNLLQQSLDQVVESCVNKVGVNLNTASKHLLTYVSGLGPQLAQNIVDYRTEEGAFTTRKQLMKVKRMGAKAFEQCAGFLRIQNAKNPLDNSAVHPEAYGIVKEMAKDQKCSVEDLINDKEIRSKISLNDYVTSEIGLPTLKDIMEELEKPGRDPRQVIKVFQFKDGIYKIEQLELGMELPGIVTNITNFGAFVDVGVKQDGLVHISQLANRFVSNPADVVQLHQHVNVKVTEVDVARKRIQLSMKDVEQ
ncbi:RNA-binding transcriptional accessory protein [Ancylomarina euxinus]|uniref:RNA-binding transcriptional accessory protein n=1 Tax=Ancylomarina euxinus TaxID=2283627 RepID=A0A425XX14_9BACT|nr:Tex family protein [Ancylomarina euxinus]MCZ4696251.1 Tex family protein [Ancylomarina euxinus]MUP16626.1 S1 RNA-binding domain-containing protein [Ancylomarina euxinus]RRG19186.1 RNA-binding transcriptional accessory protein [Ancylomarina euxinus]